MYTEDANTESTLNLDPIQHSDLADKEFEAWLDSLPPHPESRKALYFRALRRNNPYPTKKHLPRPTLRMRLHNIHRALHFLTCGHYHGLQRIQPALNLIPKPPATFTFILLLSLTATLIPGYTQETQTPPTQRTQQYADAKPRTRTSHPHIAYSDDTFTITLTGCEENEKQHWSCKYETPDGQEHWMYIPNFKPKHTTPTKP